MPRWGFFQAGSKRSAFASKLEGHAFKENDVTDDAAEPTTEDAFISDDLAAGDMMFSSFHSISTRTILYRTVLLGATTTRMGREDVVMVE